MNVFANVFSFCSAYAYNSESFAYIQCKLLKEVGTMGIHHDVPEIIVNFKTSKIKLNVDGTIIVVPFDVTWTQERIQVKAADASDSDFDCESSDNDSDSGGDSASDSDNASDSSSNNDSDSD